MRSHVAAYEKIMQQLGRVLGSLVVGMTLLVSPGWAQQPQRTIAFDEAVELALEHNVTLKQSANEVALQDLAVSRARSTFLPNLSFSTRAGQSYGRSFVQEEARVVDQTSESISGGINSSVNLFNGFRDVTTLAQARISRSVSELQHERVQQQVLFDVMSEFLSLVEQEEQVRVQEGNLAASREQLRQIEEFVSAGERPKADLFQQQAEVAKAEVALLRAEQSYELVKVNLIGTLQLDPFGEYAFAAPAIEDTLIPTNYDPSSLLQQAYANRPDLQARAEGITSAREGIQVAQSSYWPRVDLSVGYNSSYNSAVPFSFRDQFADYNRGGSVGLSFSFPLFDRFARGLSVEEARVRYDNAQLVEQDLRQQVALDVRQAFQEYEAASKRLEVTATQVRATRQALRAAEARYELGAATLVELARVRTDHVQALSEQVTTKYDLFFQKKLIEYYTGQLDPAAPLFE